MDKTGSEVTLKNSDFFTNSEVSNLVQPSSELSARRSSRSESGTVINKSLSDVKRSDRNISRRSNSKVSNLNDSNVDIVTARIVDPRVSSTHQEDIGIPETDIIDDQWSRPGENSGHGILDSNPLIQGNGKVAQTEHENCPLVKINVVKVGIYGWRKKFLYILILAIVVLVFINAALLWWIFKLLNLNWDGIGNLKVTSDGTMILDGQTIVNGDMYATSIRSSKQGSTGLRILTPDLLSIQGSEEEEPKRKKRKEAIMSMDKKSIEVSAEQFIIRSCSEGKGISFLADSNQVLVAADTLRIKNSLAIHLNRSLMTPSIRGFVSDDLVLVSPTRFVQVNGPSGVTVQSAVGTIEVNALQDVRFKSGKSGRIVLDSRRIHLKNLPIWNNKPSSSSSRGRRQEDGDEGRSDLRTENGTIVDGFSNFTSTDNDQSILTEEESSGEEESTGEEESSGQEFGGEENVRRKEPDNKKKTGPTKEKEDVYQLCICSKSGRLFMAPSESSCSSSSDPDTICND